MKIVIIGAASGFGGRLTMDILSCEALRDSHIALCDLNEKKLQSTRAYLQAFVDHHKLPAKVSAAKDFRDMLKGADIVVSSVSVGGPSYWGEPYCSEVGIPRKYGIDQVWADTVGVGGVFRFLRTGPVQLSFCLAMEKLCPEAILLNYTNPMSMLTWLHSAGSSIRNTGLCHSVQGTTKRLARVAGVPYEEVSYQVAGINHQAWVLAIRHHGEDLYPKIRAAADTHEEFEKDRVRVEMMKQFGYFVTESSEHNSEYLPYFRKTAASRKHYKLRVRKLVQDYEPPREWLKDSGIEDDGGAKIPPLQRSHEYAAGIIEAYATNQPFVYWGNVMNHGLIDNLPQDCCVEVPCLVNAEGIHPCHVGRLPPQCAALNRTNINVHELAVEAVRRKSRAAAFHAVALDPLTAATLTLPRIREMFDELWAAEGDLLAYFD
ncbi:MAG: alpha-galactosidase [Kiritimatiellia bacterium]|nr:alpha-galactosidase [Lentisphaerota bacterium]